jgi:hypothetical protein
VPSDNRYLYLGAIVAGLGIVYLVYRGVSAVGSAVSHAGGAVVDGVVQAAGAVGDAAGAAAQAVNPLNNDNIINQGFDSAYQGITGSDGTLGSDVYDGVQWVKGLVP